MSVHAWLVAFCLLPSVALADEALWSALKAGGQVVLLRHAATTPGVGDPEGMRLEDCASQRNLSEEGRTQARRLGEAFRKRGIAVQRVLSSPWCRCLDTARLAFGSAEVSLPLSNLFGRHENRDAQVAQLRKMLREAGKTRNLVLVTHGSTIGALTGVHPAMGEMVIVSPGGKVAGRLASD